MSESVEIFRTEDGGVRLDVRTAHGSVWLTRKQSAELFGRDIKTIGKHITNAQREELAGIPVVAKSATTASDGKTYQVEHYDLDLVLSVGYRVKSAEGVRFRKWANDVLRRYAIDGAVLNERRLSEIGTIVSVLARSNDELVSGVADVLSTYVPSFSLLRDFDEGSIIALPNTEPDRPLTLEVARDVIGRLAQRFPNDQLFGNERGDGLDGVIGSIYQGFGDHELYPLLRKRPRICSTSSSRTIPFRWQKTQRSCSVRHLSRPQPCIDRWRRASAHCQQCSRRHHSAGRNERPYREGSDDCSHHSYDRSGDLKTKNHF
ncbi:RhuM family protein [Brevibacterium sediminis]|uniref:RhuM family protein n=1 Tax=Brevibacterium sediminis TaxID=1857024 RepID=UPI001C575863|nr:RhuM family protein [Brevibacterium sediminis]